MKMAGGETHIFTRILITILLLLAKHQSNSGMIRRGEMKGMGERV
jgi:hypothetical protein